ncbi:hypothetical protein, partial [Nitrospira sp. BLG_2]|uniref:hypothetical protein n=1 Tax=Nitrospira sp. BLG_2 TaxID=3397507 RepID=UPI003B991CFF
ENDLRFRYVKYTNCYIDVVKLALAETETDLSNVSIPSLPLYLELGASSETMISLLGMGISRASASVISSHAPRQNMNRPDTLRWIKNTNWTGRNISRLTIQEIKDIVNPRITA